MRSRTLLIGYTLAALSLAACGGDATAPVRADMRPSGMNAGLPTVQIVGPTAINVNNHCTWYAFVSGGTPPYTYEWGSVGMVDTSTPGLSYWSGSLFPGSGWGWVGVTVTDAATQVSGALLYVAEWDGLGNPC
jgi:hypothetical protein